MATDLERLVVSLEANVKKFEKEMARSRQVTETAMRGVERSVQNGMRRVESTMSRAGANIRNQLAGFITAREIARFTDSYTKIQNSLKIAGLEGQALTDTYNQLFAAAQKNGVPVEAMAVLYGRLALTQKDLNATAPELIRFTEGVSTALRVSGQSATEASGALLQLSQALGGGTVQMEEYGSLIDGARPVLQAVAAGLEEAGGSVSKLTQLVKAGKVSSEAFFRAFFAGQHVLDEMANKTVPTLGQQLVKVQNALTDTVGKMDQAGGASKALREAIGFLIVDIGKIPAGFQSTIDEIERIITGFNRLAAAIGNVTGLSVSVKAPAVDPDRFARAAAEGEPLSLSVRSKPKTVSLASFPAGGKGGGKGGGGGGGGKSSKEKSDDYQDEVKSIRERTAALQNEATTVGKSEGEIAKAEAAFKLLEAAKKANIALTPQLKADIEKVAAAYGEATEKVDAAEKAQRRLNAVSNEVGNVLADAFKDAVLEGEKLDAVMQKLLKSFAAKSIDSVFDSIFKGGGAGNNLIGSLIGSLSSGLAPRAAGGPVSARSPYLIGEEGPELFVPRSAGRIVPNNALGGAGSSSVATTYNIDARGSTMSPGEFRAIIEQNNRQRDRTAHLRTRRAEQRYG